MSYRLRKKSLARQVRRVAREELEGTLKELLTVNDQARSTAVHEARKHLKKVRTLIRLLRPATGEAFYKDENAAMRKAAQRMSSIRDSHVRVQTIKKPIAKSGKHRAPAAFARIEAAMDARLRQVIEESEKEDWSKQAAVDIERPLGSLETPYDEIDPKRTEGRLQEGAASPCDYPAQCDRCQPARVAKDG
jgi:CHAD domain-containing protein